MRLTSVNTLASRQAETATASEDLALVRFSVSLDSHVSELGVGRTTLSSRDSRNVELVADDERAHNDQHAK